MQHIGKVDRIVVPSKSTLQALKNIGVKPEKLTLAYNVIDDTIFFPIVATEKHNLRKKLCEKYKITILEDTPILLYVGSEEDRKNMITIL